MGVKESVMGVNESVCRILSVGYKKMKPTNYETGKEFLLAYMQITTSIIQQNSTVFEKASPLIQQISNDKTPDSIKKAAEKAITKAFDGYINNQELLGLLYFVADDREVITDENKAPILDEQKVENKAKTLK
ncbi:2259_t:CDS:2 [Ambispora gerdemannii]|uniref:2259_t:CDS:1 n=1 Tax=Ambispora gerdemannii TaxID=144530 RepID=A0A9N9F6N1_9GLOM|nr:2259_t:CDS:2 [Ambispora gerdemannii]